MTSPARSGAPQTDAQAAAAPPADRRLTLVLAAGAGLCWALAAALLARGDVRAPASAEGLVYCVAALLAGLLTFIPIQRHLRTPGLALEGVAGSFVLLYTLAFVPPPTAWLLSPPDAPVYALLAAALFWSTSALALWPVHAAGQRIFRQRARRYDLRRARRQAHEVGALAALCVGLASLRVLTLVGVALLALILVVAELLFLSFVETET